MDFGINQSVVEELYLRYRDNPRAVAESWREFFDGLGDSERESLAKTEPTRAVNGATLVGMPSPSAHGGNGRNGGAAVHGNGNGGNGNGSAL